MPMSTRLSAGRVRSTYEFIKAHRDQHRGAATALSDNVRFRQKRSFARAWRLLGASLTFSGPVANPMPVPIGGLTCPTRKSIGRFIAQGDLSLDSGMFSSSFLSL